MNSALMTIAEVSSLLRVSRNTLHRWSKSGYLQPIKIGGRVRYLKSDIENFINASRND